MIRLLLFALATALPFHAAAEGFFNPGIEGGGGAGIGSGGNVDDDTDFCLGEDGDYCLRYDTASTRFELESLSGLILTVDDASVNLRFNATASVGWNGRGVIASSADGIFEISNSAGAQGVRFDTTTNNRLILTDESGNNLVLQVENIDAGNYVYASQFAVNDYVRLTSTTDGLLVFKDWMSNPGFSFDTDAGDGVFIVGNVAGTQGIKFNTGTADRLVLTDESGNAIAMQVNSIEASSSLSTSVPLFTFDGDTDTGIGRSASNELALIANGSVKFDIDSGIFPTFYSLTKLNNGFSMPDGNSAFAGAVNRIGTSSDVYWLYNTSQTNDTMQMALGADSLTYLITPQADFSTNYNFAAQSNPTIALQSSDETSTSDRIYFQHDQTDGVVAVGSGDLAIQHDQSNGARTITGGSTPSTLTWAGGGEGNKTITGFRQKGVQILGVSARVIVGNTGACTSVDVGDGSTANRYADDLAVTAGTVLGSAQWEADPYEFIPTSGTAGDLVVTVNGGNCADLEIDFVLHTREITGPTS